MSFIIFMLLLVSTSSGSLPINQHPGEVAQAKNHAGQEQEVGIHLHEVPPQSNGLPAGPLDGNHVAKAPDSQVQDVAQGKKAEDPKAPNADNGVAGKPVNNGDAKVETGAVDKKEGKATGDKKEEKGSGGKNSNITPFSKDKASADLKSHKKYNHPNATDMDSSSLKRLVLVLVAFSVLFIMYLAFRTYRRGKRRGPIIVSKYGVRTRRSDLEMRPLPLDEDDEDETVFDLGNVSTR